MAGISADFAGDLGIIPPPGPSLRLIAEGGRRIRTIKILQGDNMRIRSVTMSGILALALIAAPGGAALADNHEQGEQAKTPTEAGKSKLDTAEDAVRAEAKELEGNVEESVEIMEKTYKEKRAEGEGRVEAAGDSYEAVLEEGNKKAAEKAAEKAAKKAEKAEKNAAKKADE
ncbi:MAG: hypothetical protein DRR04_10940 [Gammaproteobacteria bacterium]|nr:MAG: hypothetical protein DRR04_10940 [Gammaproteobacteria bacterium]